MNHMAKKMHKAADESNSRFDALAPGGRTPPPGEMLSGHYHCRFGYRVVRRRGAGSWLLIVTAAGRGVFRQPQAEHLAVAGDAVLLAPDAYSDYGVHGGERARVAKQPVVRLHQGERPRGGQAGGWQFHYVHFQPTADWLPWLNWQTDGGKIPESGLQHTSIKEASTCDRVADAFQRMHQDLRQPRPWGEWLAGSALRENLVTIAQQIEGQRRQIDPRIETALAIMQQDVAASHTVRSLARAVRLSPSRFAHLFREQMGESVVQWLIRLRLEQARRMLSLTDSRVGEVAAELGFSSPYYFSRLFRRHTGQSPKSFRQLARK